MAESKRNVDYMNGRVSLEHYTCKAGEVVRRGDKQSEPEFNNYGCLYSDA